jgi:hypothetical protein
MFEDYGTEEFPRTTAVFLYSVCNFVVDECNEDNHNVDVAYRSGGLSRSRKDDEQERIERRFEKAQTVNSFINEIVITEIKGLWKRCELPKDAVIEAFKTVPEERFLRNDKVGYYINAVTAHLYDSLDEDDVDDRYNDIDWHQFFTTLFGKDNETQIAMLICVEGTSRIIKNWRNADKIRAVWDSLTAYSLDVLEGATADTRSHMLELYTKIVGTMDESNRKDLRVDLTQIDKEYFPNISKSVNAIADKISSMKKNITTNIKNNEKTDKKVKVVS